MQPISDSYGHYYVMDMDINQFVNYMSEITLCKPFLLNLLLANGHILFGFMLYTAAHCFTIRLRQVCNVFIHMRSPFHTRGIFGVPTTKGFYKPFFFFAFAPDRVGNF